MHAPLHKIIVVVGPTASGKTGLAIELAKACGGEVISADSRQVYRGLDIGTEKVAQEEMQSVPHHLIDIREPTDTYTAADFVRDADAVIADVIARGNVPIVAGGTLFYVDALLGNISLAEVPKNAALRKGLDALSTKALADRLVALDPAYAQEVDLRNRRRLERAIEVITARGGMPKQQTAPRYDALVIGIEVEREVLRKRIEERLQATLNRGLIEETKAILASSVSEDRLNEIGLEYRIVLQYLHGLYSYDEMQTILVNKLWQYAKRQRTWLKRMKDVQWYKREDTEKIFGSARNFLKME